jgi:hypothetical protein
MFPSQGSDSNKVFVFKMSEVGPGTGVDLVKRMQPGGDLEDAWMMFDHVKRIKKWTTMACHVYDSTYWINTGFCVSSTRMPLHQMNMRLDIVPSRHGGCPPGPQQSRA